MTKLEHRSAAATPTSAEGCRVEAFLKLVSQEWVSHILHALSAHGPQQFGALRRALPRGVSARVLSAKLKTLESLGHVTRSEGHAGRIRTVTYALTESGAALDAVLRSTELSLARAHPVSERAVFRARLPKRVRASTQSA